VIKAEYDIRLLNEQISNMKGFLLGTGATPGQCQDLLRVQAGLLAWEISKQVGPATLPAARKKVERDMRNVFFPLKPHTPPGGFSGRQIGTQPDFMWLFAYGGKEMGRETSFLVGADAKDVQLNAGPDLLGMFYKKENRTRGSAWQDLGEYSHIKPDKTGRMRPHFKRWRTTQHALKLNRIVITPAAYAAMKREILERIGQLRASFAATTVALGLKKTVPAWVTKQISAVESNGKSVFNGSAMNHPTNPVIEFGSRAKGVVSNPIVADAIRGAIKRRSALLAAGMMRVLKGAAYNFNTGATYFPKTTIPEDE
jgi:hypothetical protein